MDKSLLQGLRFWATLYKSQKSIFSGLQFCRWQYWIIFIHLAVIPPEFAKFRENSTQIAVQGHTRSSILLVSIESVYATSY